MGQLKNALEVFDAKQKRSLIYLAFIIFVDAFVELLGVTVILPFINAIMSPDALLENEIVRWFYDRLHMQSTDELIIWIAVLIIGIYIFKNLFLVYMYNLQYRFSYYGKNRCRTP